MTETKNYQQSISLNRVLDPQRLREVGQERDKLQAQSKELRNAQLQTNASLQEAQKLAASRESDLEALNRLSERLLNDQQQKERRRNEEAALE